MELGWLSPDGQLIEADYMEHLALASDLCKKYYGIEVYESPDEFLMDCNWVHITITTFMEHAYHVFWKRGKHLTSAQKYYLKPKVEIDWEWINRSCQLNLKEELELDLEISESSLIY